MRVNWFIDSDEYICCEENGETTRMFRCAEGIDPNEIVNMFNDAQKQYEEGKINE